MVSLPVTQPITHESVTNHAQIGFVCACASRSWGVSGKEITDESRMNYAWTAHVLFTPTDESLTCARQFCKWKSVDVGGMNVIRALFMGDMKVGRQWTDVDVRGFEPVLTHKHWRPTCLPRIVEHTRRINYARRLMNNAHRRTVVRRNIFFRSKLKITHKPPETHIHLQSMTVHVRSTDELRIRRTLRAETKMCA